LKNYRRRGTASLPARPPQEKEKKVFRKPGRSREGVAATECPAIKKGGGNGGNYIKRRGGGQPIQEKDPRGGESLPSKKNLFSVEGGGGPAGKYVNGELGE